MNAFENAKKFFDACEALEGWAGCKEYVVNDAPFVAQSEPLVDINTVEAYCEWMAGFGKDLSKLIVIINYQNLFDNFNS